MNTLRIYPKKFREKYERNIKNAGIIISPERYHNFLIGSSMLIAFIAFNIFYFLEINVFYTIIIFLLINIFSYIKINLMAGTRIRKIEKVFPDVISLMSSNLRAGITIDRAFLLSTRPEFDPLDKEILRTGKEIATGKDVISAFKSMGERIQSEKISRVITLIISGIKAGGNIAELLEETSKNMKEQDIIEKKISTSVLMYMILIFFSVSIGAPVLFGLSTILVEVILNITSKIPAVDYSSMTIPITFTKVPISVNFVIYFSVLFIIATNFLSSLVLGLVSKGEGKRGLKYFIPLVILSIGLFFLIRFFLSGILTGVMS